MSPKYRTRVIVGLSGGVDSAVSALLLQKQGYRVEGLFMKNWEEDDREGYCAAEADLTDAGRVAEALGIPLRTANFSSEYWDRVFSQFLDEYRRGRTPNPDILCNSRVKFDAFLEHALMLGAEKIATGHYASLRRTGDGIKLCCARDESKDQTYFLHALNQRQLAHSLFPLGDLLKSEVRHIAMEQGLAVSDKKDSTGICFIGERRFRDFLSRYIPSSPGPVEDIQGTRVGEHRGLCFYTPGQRQGLGIGGRAGAAEAPWYVVGKDVGRNTLIVAQGHNNPRLFHQGLEGECPQWISHTPPRPVPFDCLARIRHRQPLQPCTIIRLDDESFEVAFRSPQRAVAPGQSIVFYFNRECLGGGVISAPFRCLGTPSTTAGNP